MKPSVFVAIFSLDERDGWLSPDIAQFLASLSIAAKERPVCLSISANKKPVDYARNCIVKEFLSSDFEWLLLLDNDMGPRPGLLSMIDRAEAHMGILVPKFYVFSNQVKECAAHPRLPLTLMWNCLAVPDKSEWHKLDAAGTGCMFIHRSVLQAIGENPFRFRYADDGSILQGEDLTFCEKAQAAGFFVWGNQGFEVDHYKTTSLSALAQAIGVVVPSSTATKRTIA